MSKEIIDPCTRSDNPYQSNGFKMTRDEIVDWMIERAAKIPHDKHPSHTGPERLIEVNRERLEDY